MSYEDSKKGMPELLKNHIRYVLCKVSNFAINFYVILTLHKKSRQSLKPSTGRIGWDCFSKIGIEWGTYFVKKVPNFEIVWLVRFYVRFPGFVLLMDMTYFPVGMGSCCYETLVPFCYYFNFFNSINLFKYLKYFARSNAVVS